jgi:hypothetical protein
MAKASFWERRKFFDSYGSRPNEQSMPCIKGNMPVTCPCCGYPIMWGGTGEICELCDWEGFEQDDNNADEIIVGPNRGLSLTKARLNFQNYLRKYPPDDPYHKPDSEERLAYKLKLIAAFDAIMNGPSTQELEKLWQTVDECKQGLYQELKRAVFGELFAPTPCPYCGENLRTAKAMQCRKCGVDWHDPNNLARLPVKSKL